MAQIDKAIGSVVQSDPGLTAAHAPTQRPT
jgi:hypothetical protein